MRQAFSNGDGGVPKIEIVGSSMEANEIIDYFRNHKLNAAGIRNFLMYRPEAREFVERQILLHPEYGTLGGYIVCLVEGIELPRCVVCGRTIEYKSYRNGHRHCSRKCFSQDREISRKRTETVMKRYGIKNVGEDERVKEKRTSTMIQRYGVDSALKSEVFLKKQKDSMVRRFGVDSYQKTVDSKRKHYAKAYQTILGWSDYVMPMFSEDEYHGWKHGEVYRWRCAECGEEFESDLHVTQLYGIERLPRCPKCHPPLTNESTGEVELRNFISLLYRGEMCLHEKKMLGGPEIDIYLPAIKVGFEYDGLFFHNEFSGKDSSYHLYKTEECERRGVRLVHVFEDEWLFHRKIVEDRIRNIIGVGGEKIYARNCVLKQVEAKETDDFLNQNHLQGGDNASVRYGLFHRGELVSVMTFGRPRFARSYDWEMIRFASKLGTVVVGGASRLLKAFSRSHRGIVVSYADRRYSVGKLYEKLGFNKIGNSKPNYWWCKNKIKLSRYQCQKRKLRKLLGDGFDEKKSEADNMHANGWSKVYDCGNIVFSKRI